MAVGNRANSFVHLARFIAQFSEYTKTLLDHLVDSKVAHWDPQIRELAANSLAALADVAPQYMIRNLLPRLVDMTTSKDMETRFLKMTLFMLRIQYANEVIIDKRLFH